jgi:hypothetical protein
MLFGTLDENDAAYYNEQIKHFERDSENTTTLLKQQVYVVKSTLRALNDTEDINSSFLAIIVIYNDFPIAKRNLSCEGTTVPVC